MVSAEAAQALVVIIGPTGTGKSDLSLTIAEELLHSGVPCEIVNADAMQLYRGMDIGTAKIPTADRRGIPHHMLDVLNVSDESAVATYQQQARAIINEVRDRGAVPVLVGGSGLYVSSVIFDLRFPGTDALVRSRLESELSEVGPDGLYHSLKSLDPASADVIGNRNGRRLVRALEVIEITGEPYDAGLPEAPLQWSPVTILGLRAPRAELIHRLDERVHSMWRLGFLNEVKALIPAGIERGVTASKAIGYAQALAQLAGTMSEAEAVALTQQLTRRYARRQVSWFSRYEHARWLDYDSPRLTADALQLVRGSI